MLNYDYDEDKGAVITTKELGLHICNDTDEFFKPDEHQASFIDVQKQYSYCIDNIKDLELWGNADSAPHNTLQVRLLKCDYAAPNNTCKTEAEINDWIDQNGHLTMLANEYEYLNEKYGEHTISQHAVSTAKPIAHYTKDLQNYLFELHDIESEEMLHGLNFRTDSLPIVKLIITNTYNDGFNPLSVGGFQIGMSLNKLIFDICISYIDQQSAPLTFHLQCS